MIKVCIGCDQEYTKEHNCPDCICEKHGGSSMDICKKHGQIIFHPPCRYNYKCIKCEKTD